jgi:hypothetical protein
MELRHLLHGLLLIIEEASEELVGDIVRKRGRGISGPSEQLDPKRISGEVAERRRPLERVSVIRAREPEIDASPGPSVNTQTRPSMDPLRTVHLV